MDARHWLIIALAVGLIVAVCSAVLVASWAGTPQM